VAEEARVKPKSMFIEEAIRAALETRWQDAVSLNRALIETHGGDEGTYNRLAKALTECGDYKEALQTYGKTLELNPLNLIAQKNVRKLTLALESNQNMDAGAVGAIDVNLFAEEPGKSTLTTLIPRPGLSVAVGPGDTIDLHEHDGALQAQTSNNVVLGDVDPKIARRLIPLMATGNRYTAAVAHADREIEIVIREAFQSAENIRKTSFPVVRGSQEEFRSYAKASLLTDRDSAVTGTSEEDGDLDPQGAAPPDDPTSDDEVVLDELDDDDEATDSLEETDAVANPERDDADQRPEEQY